MAVKCPKCHAENPDTKSFCADCGTRLPPAKDIPWEFTETVVTPLKELIRGSTFARRFDIIEELGKGGMGKVYRVFDKKVEEEVALKLIKPEIAADRETIKRFSDELKLARRIAHRNVCKMYELMEAECRAETENRAPARSQDFKHPDPGGPGPADPPLPGKG
ncbi:MAG: zinc-ribbon domain-containing protein [Candidatus Aminicenantales bacterium]